MDPMKHVFHLNTTEYNGVLLQSETITTTTLTIQVSLRILYKKYFLSAHAKYITMQSIIQRILSLKELWLKLIMVKWLLNTYHRVANYLKT